MLVLQQTTITFVNRVLAQMGMEIVPIHQVTDADQHDPPLTDPCAVTFADGEAWQAIPHTLTEIVTQVLTLSNQSYGWIRLQIRVGEIVHYTHQVCAIPFDPAVPVLMALAVQAETIVANYDGRNSGVKEYGGYSYYNEEIWVTVDTIREITWLEYQLLRPFL